jgi:hypothetical protein
VYEIGFRLEGSENGVVDTYNGTGLMNGFMDDESKPGQSRVSKGGYSLLVVVWHQLDRRRENSESFGSRGKGLESNPLLAFHSFGARGAIK